MTYYHNSLSCAQGYWDWWYLRNILRTCCMNTFSYQYIPCNCNILFFHFQHLNITFITGMYSLRMLKKLPKLLYCWRIIEYHFAANVFMLKNTLRINPEDISSQYGSPERYLEKRIYCTNILLHYFSSWYLDNQLSNWWKLNRLLKMVISMWYIPRGVFKSLWNILGGAFWKDS